VTLSRRNPRVIYHYTSADGLFGILDKGAVWASDTRFMNDSEELKMAIGAMARRVEARLPRVTGRENRGAIESALSMAVQPGLSAYVASFSEAGNMLSQWRAYAPRDGVSIGFFTNALRAVPGFRLGRCEYIDDRDFVRPPLPPTLRRITRNLDRCVGRLARLRGRSVRRRTSTESVGDLRYEYKLTLVHCMLHHAIWLKHRGFEEEREWRLARYEPPYYYPEDPPPEFSPKFRKGALGVTPFLSATLAAKFRGKPLGLAEIILGPSPNGKASAAAVREMLQSRFDSVVPARWCEIPYRGW